MKYVRWLNPVLWVWALFYVYRAITLIAFDWRHCTECEWTGRGEPLPFENLCDTHQERFRATFGEAIEAKWDTVQERLARSKS